MAAKRKNAFQRVESAVVRAPKRGLTATEVAARTGVAINTVKAYLQSLKGQGRVEVIGRTQTGKAGRPANLYRA